MSSRYPILDNRPINQWKVTELREELRRRNIPIKGLKEELVRKLDEALRNERGAEAIQEELGNGLDPDANPQDKGGQEEAEPMAEEHANAVADEIVKYENDAPVVEIDHHTLGVNQDNKVQDGDVAPVMELDAVAAETAVKAVYMEDSTSEIENVVAHCDLSGQDSRSDEKPEDLQLLVQDVKCSLSEPADQVSEVSPDLGPEVKCESISTDSVSIIEKNELKDNLNADNFHLELDVVKPEMVQPSSSDVPPIGGDLHPLEDDKELVKNQITLEETDVKYATNVDLSKKEDSVDGGSPEKLNLDRSSGDESMEEDILESKHVESNIKSDELGERTEVSKCHAVEGGNHDDAKVARSSPDKKDTVNEEKMEATATSEKRKLEVNEAVGNNETIKRQRRWNPDTIKVPERQTSNISTSSASKDAIQTTPTPTPTPKRTFNRSDSTASGDSPKERIVPPPLRPATTSLKIDRFLRPFTLKAVQELLGKTGSVCNFWMDHIKTHCYVTYSSVEEAVATRNAVYNLQWPSNGGRLLVAEFVDPQEVKMRLEAPPESPTPISPSPIASKPHPFHQPQAPPPQPQRQHASRQQLPPPPTLPPPPPLSSPPAVRERLPPPPPPAEKKPEPPVVTLDDLFKKTKATPRIYYLPLSEEQVAAKLAAQGMSVKE